MAAPLVHEAEKRQALEQVLQSVTFLRATQVRNFLHYICEMEFAGRGRQLTATAPITASVTSTRNPPS